MLHPQSDDLTTVRVTVTRVERVCSLETVIAPLGESLRGQPVYWDFPLAIINADILNVRSGPGANYDKLGQGEHSTLDRECSELKIVTKEELQEFSYE